MKRRIVSIITALAMCLSMLPPVSFAAEVDDTGLCPHHTEHTEDCGYATSTEGTSCNHEHTADCYTLGILPGDDAYIVAEDTENFLDCPHVHDEACGYVPADPGQPCGYECHICPVQALIDALPDKNTITAENAPDAEMQITAIDEAKATLSSEETDALDMTRYEAVFAALEAVKADILMLANQDEAVQEVIVVDRLDFSSSTSGNGNVVEGAVTDLDFRFNQPTVVTDYTIAGGGTARWEPAGEGGVNTLTLNNVNMQGTRYLVGVPDNTEIILVGENSIEATEGDAICAQDGMLTIKSSSETNGSLNVTASASNSYALYSLRGGIALDIAGALTVENGGIRANNGPLSIKSGGKINVQGSLYGKERITAEAGTSISIVNPNGPYGAGVYGSDCDSVNLIAKNGDLTVQGTGNYAVVGSKSKPEIFLFASGNLSCTGSLNEGSFSISGKQVNLSGTIPTESTLFTDCDVCVPAGQILNNNGTLQLYSNGRETHTVTVAGTLNNSGRIVNSSNKVIIPIVNDGGTLSEKPYLDFTAIPAPTGEGFTWDSASNTLTLTNFDNTAKNPTGAAIVLPDGAKLILTGENKVLSKNQTAIKALGSLEISGKGSLVGTGAANSAFIAEGDVTIRDCTLTLITTIADNFNTSVIQTNGHALTIDGRAEVLCKTEKLSENGFGIDTGGGALTINKEASVTIAGTHVGILVNPPTGAEDAAVNIFGALDTTGVTGKCANLLGVKLNMQGGAVQMQEGTQIYLYQKDDTLNTSKGQTNLSRFDGSLEVITGNSAAKAIYHKVTVKNSESNEEKISLYAAGTDVSFDAEEIEGKVFKGWTVDGAEPDTTTGSKVSFTVPETGDVTVTASYTDYISISSATVEVTGEYIYNGTAHKPESVTVKLGEKVLMAEMDYTLSYDNNINAGKDTAVVTVTGKGSYKDSIDGHFTIAPAPLAIKANKQEITYGGNILTDVSQATAAGLVTGHTLASITLTPSNTEVPGGTITPSAAVIKNGEMDMTSNYSITYEAGTLTINKSTPAINFKAGYTPGKIYDGKEIPNPTADALDITGAAFENVQFIWTQNGTAAIPKDAGTYTLTASIPATDNTETATVTKEVTVSPKTLDGSAITLEKSNYEYTGSAIIPVVTIADKELGYTLKVEEYTVEYSSNINHGTATVTITDKDGGNYIVNGTKTFEITKPMLNTATVTLGQTTFTYNGTGQTPAVTVEKGGKTLTEDTDYTVSYKDNLNAGTASVTVTGKDNYEGSQTVTFTINPKPVTAVVTAANKHFDGTNNATVNAQVNDSDLVNGDSITISGVTGTFNDENVGTEKTVTIDSSQAMATGNGTGNYTITFPATTKADIERATVTITWSDAAQSVTYTGNSAAITEPAVTAENNVTVSVTLEYSYAKQGDTTFTADLPVNTGIYTVRASIAESDNLTAASADMTLTIQAKEVTDPVITLSQNSYEYDGTAKEPTVTVMDGSTKIDSSEYTVKYSDNTAAGTATVEIADNADGNYKISGSTTFTITKPSLESAKVTLSQTSYTYDGTAKKPTVTVEKGGKTLTEDTDYTVSYESNVNAGTASVTVEGIGNYEGSKTVTFTIQPKTVTAVVTAENKHFDGTNNATVNAQVNSSDLVNGDSITITGVTGTFDDENVGTGKTVTIDSSKATVTGNDTGNYAITFPATTKADIERATVTITWSNATQSVTYTGNSAAITEPAVTAENNVTVSVTPEYSHAKQGDTTFTTGLPVNTGTYTVRASIAESDNLTSASADMTLTIQAKEVTDPVITLSQNSYEYDGTAKKPTVTVMDGSIKIDPGEYTVKYSDNTAAGTATVEITDNADGNYQVSGSTTFTITKPLLDTATVTLEQTNFTYNGAEHTPAVTVEKGGKTLTEDSDYTVSYESNVNAGTASVTVTGKDNYEGSKTVTFTINPKAVTAVVTAANKHFDGTNKATVTVQVNDSDLVTGDSITISGVTGIFEDENVGTEKTVTIDHSKATVTGNDNGNYTITFPTTTKANIEKATITITWSDTAQSVTYTGNSATVTEPTVTAENNVISVTPEYSYAKEGDTTFTAGLPVNAGTYTIRASIAESDNLTSASADMTLTILAKEVTDPVITLSQNSYEYDGTAKEPTVTVMDGSAKIDPSEYTVEYENNINVGDNTAIVTITDNNANGNYVITEKSVNFTITTASISHANVEVGGSYTYTGTAYTPDPTVILGDKKLVKDADYTVSYVDNTNAGTATVTVTGQGNYKDSVDGKFTIAPASLTIKANDQEITYGENIITSIEKVTATGLVDGDTLAGVTLTPSTTAVPGGTITPSAAAVQNGDADMTGNYAITYQDGKLIINKSAPTIRFKTDYNPSKIYDGKKIPNPTADVLDITGAKFEDVQFSWSGNPVNTGTYILTATIPATDNTDEAAAKWENIVISAKEVTDPIITLSQDSYVYDGGEKKPDVTVTFKEGDETITIPGSEYTVTYTNNVHVDGVPAVAIKDNENGNYIVGNVSKTFTITSAPITGAKVEVTGEYAYTGKAHEPATVTVKLSEKTLTAGTDYTLFYGSNVNAGDATVTVTGTGDYKDSVDGKFTIAPAPLTIKANSQTITYGENIATDIGQVTAAGLLNGDTLASVTLTPSSTAVSDGTITPSAATIKNGDADMTGNYAITYQDGKLTINKSTPTIRFKADYTPGKTYDGKEIPYPTADVLDITGAKFEDVQFSWSDSPVNAGTYTLTATIPATDTTHEATAKWENITITAKEVTATVTTEQASYIYTGTAITPKVEVKDGNTIIPDSEYTVEYSSNTDAGNAAITIKDADGGNYIVTGSTTFEITKAGQAELHITGQPDSIVYGDAFTLETSGGSGDGAVTWVVKEGSASMDGSGHVTVTGTGRITVTATKAGNANYNEAAASIVLTSVKKELTVTGVTAKDRAYDGTATVSITGVTLNGTLEKDDVSVNTSGLTGTIQGTDVGEYTAVMLPTMTLQGTAADNYTLIQPAEAVSASVKINKAALTPKTGDLAVVNETTNEYIFGLNALLPDVPEGMNWGGTVTYTLGEIRLDGYYTDGARIDSQTLTLPILAVHATEEKEVGTIAVILHTGNFEDMTAVIHVRSVNKPSVEVTGVSLNRDSLTLTVGESFPLTATITPSNASNKAVAWASDNPAIAAVNGDGTVTAVSAGTTAITVTTPSGNHSASCTVTVKAKQYSIAYQANGGSGTMNQDTATDGKAFTLPGCGFTPPEGKVFDTWAIGSTNGEQVKAGENRLFTGNTTLYAIWKDAPAITYAITYQANGGSGTMNQDTATDGKAFTLPGCGFTPPEGKVFDTWAIGSTNGEQVKAGENRLFTGNTTLYAIWKDAPAVTYAITYQANGGSGTMNRGIAPRREAFVLPGCGFTAPDGKEFDCWAIGSIDGIHIQPGGSYKFTGNTTLYAIWKDLPYSITGMVQQDGKGVPSATVQLKQGEEIARQITDEHGHFTFTKVSSGIYNLVAEKDISANDKITMTVKQEIDKNSTDLIIILPTGRTNSVVEVSPETPPVIVGKLDTIFTTEDYTDTDKEVVNTGGAVEFKLVVEKKEAPPAADAIETIKPSNQTLGLFLDLTITKTVTPQSGAPESTTIVEVDSLIETLISLPPELQGKDNYTVYREHEGKAEALPDSGSGERYEVSKDKTAITIFARKYSTYAISWSDNIPVPVEPDRPDRPDYPSSSGSPAHTYAAVVKKPEHGQVLSNFVHAASGTTVTLTITPDSGYMLHTLIVADSLGNEIEWTAKDNNQYTFIMPNGAVTITTDFAPFPEDVKQLCDGGVNCPSHSFTDFGAAGTWYHEAVDYVLRNGLMNGYGDGRFGPDNTLSRAQLAQILYNRAGRPDFTGTSPFTDVADGAWYANAITWAAVNGIVGGYGDGLFGPDDPITREQLAVMLWRYTECPVATNKELHFNDTDEAGDYALDALRWAVENGILNGYGDGQLHPAGQATRAQAAAMLMRYWKDKQN